MRSQLAVGAWAALLQVHTSLVPRIDLALQQATGMPLAWYDVLLELAAAPGRRLTMSELGERAVLSRSRVSRIVDELVIARLVSRVVNLDDGRSTYAALTEDGLNRYRFATPHYLDAIETEFAGRLTDAELDAVATALRKVMGPQPVPLALRPPDQG